MVAVVVVLLVVGGLGWGFLAGVYGSAPVPPSGITPSPTVSSAANDLAAAPCDQLQVCLGRNAYALHITIEFTFILPNGWTSRDHGGSDADFFSAQRGYGVSVAEDLAPAGMGSGVTAESVARWLAARPFLVSSAVTRTSLVGKDGGIVPHRLTAWQVDVHLKPDQQAGGHCLPDGSQPCVPLLLTEQRGFRSEGMWGNEWIRWIFLDLPDGQPAAVFIWDFANHAALTPTARQLINSMVFS
jgi:hypothetical protein